MESETCRLCGGDGRIGNALGRSTATCPGCHGSGRRADTSTRFRDVTKTKQSHYERPPSAPSAPAGPRGPVTSEGLQLAREVRESTVLNEETKTRLLGEIVNHESTHGRCTQTFMKKIRKQARPGQPNL
jgi:hypothetical protein